MQTIFKTELIENYIIENGLTKRKFCEMCKMNPNTLNRILSGDRVQLFTISKIVKVMKIKPREILGR